MADLTDRTWELIQEQMPTHDCGKRLEPGGVTATGHLLVCTSCSYIAQADPEWVAQVVAKASAQAAEEAANDA